MFSREFALILNLIYRALVFKNKTLPNKLLFFQNECIIEEIKDTSDPPLGLALLIKIAPIDYILKACGRIMANLIV